MIYAMITICNMVAVSSCLFISDTYGPYNSIDECLNRVAEILEDSNRVLSREWYARSFSCRLEHGIKYRSRNRPQKQYLNKDFIGI